MNYRHDIVGFYVLLECKYCTINTAPDGKTLTSGSGANTQLTYVSPTEDNVSQQFGFKCNTFKEGSGLKPYHVFCLSTECTCF